MRGDGFWKIGLGLGWSKVCGHKGSGYGSGGQGKGRYRWAL